MKFITDEKEIKIPTNGVLCFYNSSNEFIMNKLLFTFLLQINNNVFCVDLNQFKSSIKRFDIKEIPTVILFKNDVESARAVGIIKEEELEKFNK
jgi:hypothetical protein